MRVQAVTPVTPSPKARALTSGVTPVTAVTPLQGSTGTTLLASDLACALDPVVFARALGFDPDPWQEELLRGDPHYGLVCCSRQAGKSTVAAVACLHRLIYRPKSTVLLLAKAERQAQELLGKVRDLLGAVPNLPKVTAEGTQHLRLANGSRALALPGKGDTVRGFSAVDLLIVDEASRVDRSLIVAVRPMLAVSGGRFWALSTPNGTTGWFYEAWQGGPEWHRWQVPATDIPRIPTAFLEAEKAAMPEAMYRQEYLCSFEDVEGAVFTAADLVEMTDPDCAEW